MQVNIPSISAREAVSLAHIQSSKVHFETQIQNVTQLKIEPELLHAELGPSKSVQTQCSCGKAEQFSCCVPLVNGLDSRVLSLYGWNKRLENREKKHLCSKGPYKTFIRINRVSSFSHISVFCTKTSAISWRIRRHDKHTQSAEGVPPGFPRFRMGYSRGYDVRAIHRRKNIQNKKQTVVSGKPSKMCIDFREDTRGHV